tara:strand:+ start:2237 stop:3616 length:1380 start_codon:yes stop_codon:yes gene_type:complete
MKKNVVWWPAIVHKENAQKYGDYNYFEYTRKSWEYWCERNDVLFVPFTEPVEDDLFRFRPNWQKIIFVFDELERLGIDYDQIFLADSSCMIKWNAPNIFELTDRKFVGWNDRDNMRWIYDSIQGYKSFFNGFELDQYSYVSSGVIIFNEIHKEVIQGFKKLYLDNIDKFIDLQDNIVKKGNDQTPLNYWLQINNVELNLDLPIAFKLTHMHRKDLFSHNWQDGDDKTPFFIKYGYNWVFNGIPKDTRSTLIKETWDLVGHNYNMDTAKYDKILDGMLHKDTAKYTTSRKLKLDILEKFGNGKYKDKTIVEIGASQGQSTRMLSHIFKRVIAVEWDDWNLEQAHSNNSDRTNVEFVKMDLYNDKWEDHLPKDVDVVFIDAGHEYYQVKMDIENSFKRFGNPIFIFDDYGFPPGEVKQAIDEKVNVGDLVIDKFIGEKPEDLVHASGTKFFDMEGVICNAK